MLKEISIVRYILQEESMGNIHKSKDKQLKSDPYIG